MIRSRIASERAAGLARLKATTLAACTALCTLATAVPAGAKETFTAIDVPGAQWTAAAGINDDGVIVGTYGYCGGSVIGSFVRAPDGTITTFTLLSCAEQAFSGTFAASVNDKGEIAGSVRVRPNSYGFVRRANGKSTRFTMPWNGVGTQTGATAINKAGVATGVFELGTGGSWGFVRGSNGKMTLFAAPDSFQTYALGINDSGTVVGYYGLPTNGFVRSPDGTITTIRPSGSKDSRVIAINNAGTVTGYYNDSRGFDNGFVRTPDGTITSFIAFGTTQMTPSGINDRGEIAGSYALDHTSHGFVRTADGTITSFDPPGSGLTVPLAINSKGAITGWYADANGEHGFLRTK